MCVIKDARRMGVAKALMLAALQVPDVKTLSKSSSTSKLLGACKALQIWVSVMKLQSENFLINFHSLL